MKLRNWQIECINSAINKFKNVSNHFLALATPGAGKTMMASALAKNLHEQGMIDLVICFSPSSIVAKDFSSALTKQFDAEFDGEIGALGNSFTYQRLNTLSEKTWHLFEKYRVFVIFDEIHHCAGSNINDANSWGVSIIERIKNKAKYTIALTGTPWRSDALPIALSQYCNNTKKIHCDYVYGLKEAIRDNVCRVPKIVAVDNDNITVVDGDNTSNFTSFMDLLSQPIIPYSMIVENDQVIEQLLIRAKNKLDQLRVFNSSAGGLIVAASISHAWKIHQILIEKLNEFSVIVTSNEDDPNRIISQFRNNTDKWIISVGMISEGTNIPRLQICCHLTNIKTELHFRQILGRILRVTDSQSQEAILYMPAEPKLVEYALRISNDIPEEVDVVKIEVVNDDFTTEVIGESEKIDLNNTIKDISDMQKKTTIEISESALPLEESFISCEDNNQLTMSYEKMVDIFGRFKDEVLEHGLFEPYGV
jgi:superfamily II DNA or RNA helicase